MTGILNENSFDSPKEERKIEVIILKWYNLGV